MTGDRGPGTGDRGGANSNFVIFTRPVPFYSLLPTANCTLSFSYLWLTADSWFRFVRLPADLP